MSTDPKEQLYSSYTSTPYRIFSLPKDEVIHADCEKGPQEQEAAEDMEAMAMKAQQLMMQGRQREALALLQRVGESSQGIHAKNLGPEGIEIKIL